MNEYELTVDSEGNLTIPPDALKELGWNEGDVLQWIENDDGSFLLKKHEFDSKD